MKSGRDETKTNVYVMGAIAMSAITKLAPLGSLTPLARFYGHDIALPILFYMLVRTAFSRSIYCALLAFALCAAGEFLQLGINFPRLAGLPFFGTFDWWDFFAYAIGASVAVTLDRFTLRD